MNCFSSPYKCNPPRVRDVVPPEGAQISRHTMLKKHELTLTQFKWQHAILILYIIKLLNNSINNIRNRPVLPLLVLTF